MSSVSIVRPSRRIVIESAIAAISLSLCEMITQVMPSSRRPRSRSSRCAESSSLSAAVGSSRISSFTSFDSAFAISTSCCLPTPMSSTGRDRVLPQAHPREQLGRPRGWCGSSRSARGVARSLPRKMFSAIESCGHSASSWWMMTMPRCSLSRMSANAHGSPSKLISPVVGAVRVHPRQHLHQRRLAGAVLAADRVDLAAAHRQVDVLQRLDAGEGLGDPAHLQDVVGHDVLLT